MRCPKCCNNMVALFTSYVCDYCDPPAGSTPTKPEVADHDEWYWRPFDDTMMPTWDDLVQLAERSDVQAYYGIGTRYTEEWYIPDPTKIMLHFLDTLSGHGKHTSRYPILVNASDYMSGHIDVYKARHYIASCMMQHLKPKKKKK